MFRILPRMRLLIGIVVIVVPIVCVVAATESRNSANSTRLRARSNPPRWEHAGHVFVLRTC